MRKLTIFLIVAVLAVGTLSAQTKNEKQREPREQRERPDNSVTVEGTLKLERGFIALQSGDSVYFVPSLMRYTGFISELREGANVSVEGYAFRNMLHPKKITVAGKSYDLIAAGPRPGSEVRNDDGRERKNVEPGRNNRGPGRNNFGPNRRPGHYRPSWG